MLVDDTRLSPHPIKWDTPLATLIRDDFVMTDDYYTSHISLEDALSHRSGLPSHDYATVSASSPREAVRRLRYLPLTAEIRTTFQYCNLMFTTVSHALETVTGMWLGDLFRTRIWEPLGMDSTYFSLGDALKATKKGNPDKKVLAHGYFWAGPVVNHLEEPWMDIPAVSGAGNIISNVVDYAKYLQMMLDIAPPVSIAGHVALRTPRSFMVPQLFAFGSVSAYSLGWDLSEYRDLKIFEHQGGVPGFGALMLYSDQRRWGLAIMGNTGATSNAVALILKYHLLDELLKVPMNSRFPWKEVMDRQLEWQSMGLKHAKQILFPDALPPGKGLPTSFPLDRYTGTYAHPAYGTLNLAIISPAEHPPFFNVSTDTLRTTTVGVQTFTWDFEHMGGEYFLVRSSAPKGTAGEHLELSDVYKAEFVLGADRKVVKLGVAIVPSMRGDMIWYERA